MDIAKFMRQRALTSEQLRWRCKREYLNFSSTRDLTPYEGILGQQRAIEALRLGLQLHGPDDHLFICAPQNTGARTIFRHVLSQIIPNYPLQPSDRCYVHNFRCPRQPRLLTLPAGHGSVFQQAMSTLTATLYRASPAPKHPLSLAQTQTILQGPWNTLLQTLGSDLAAELQEYLQQVRQSLERLFTCPPGLDSWSDMLRQYQVNLVLPGGGEAQPPLICEEHPTPARLFGGIACHPPGQASDHLDIYPGVLCRADGGFLLLPVQSLLAHKDSWQRLKAALCKQCWQPQINDPQAEQYLQPEPMPLKLKVVLLGTAKLYYRLYQVDLQFRSIFRIKVDLEADMDITPELYSLYARWVKKICQQEKLRDFTQQAVASLMEVSARRSKHQGTISTRFGEIVQLMREAHHQAKGPEVTAADITQARRAQKVRVNLTERRLQRLITRGQLYIRTAGVCIGQINALTVISLGYHTFGRPSRVSASVGMGKNGIINIEREAKLSGKSHDKGILILSGYLRSQYAQQRPLSLTAAICFEQSYSGVDGDSASLAELLALLSALAQKPLRQDIAVTGSISQSGEVQPVGSINQKIEGFFDLCQERTLSGSQGVVIPRTNVADLQLKQEVVTAVANARFHIWAVQTVDQALTIFTGLPTGQYDPSGRYPPNTINALIQQRLINLAQEGKNLK